MQQLELIEEAQLDMVTGGMPRTVREWSLVGMMGLSFAVGQGVRKPEFEASPPPIVQPIGTR